MKPRSKFVRKIWHESAWEEYVAWQREDAKTLKRINLLLQCIDRNGTAGIGNPEPLRGNLSGWWSVRINQADRIVFRISALVSGENALEILQCKGHYDR